jgi:hypothetical protein
VARARCRDQACRRPEAGYFSTNDPPQGEVYIRGPAIFKGYYKRPDLDDEAFTSDRWFKTGDIGQWNKDGTLSIIDRIKNLVKLQGGEYVALEHLESIYKSASFVANGAVLANPQHTKPAMIVMAHPVNLPAFAKKNGLAAAGEDLETMCKDPEVVDACLKEMNAVGKKQGLKGMELLEALILTPDEWTPESGLLTAAQSESMSCACTSLVLTLCQSSSVRLSRGRTTSRSRPSTRNGDVSSFWLLAPVTRFLMCVPAMDCAGMAALLYTLTFPLSVSDSPCRECI